MRQRVGFARALSVDPDALLMDEPFSALDVLTAANLRGGLTRLWESHDFPVKAVLIVTHNIEEAVQLADRILVLSSNPGRIKAELPVTLPRPRDRHEAGFEALVDTVYGILTGREDAAADIDTSKALFGRLISERAPLIKAIMGALRATNDGTLREGFFLDLLRRGFSDEEARKQLDIAIDWGRYGELFEYDAESGQLVLGSDPAKVGVL